MVELSIIVPVYNVEKCLSRCVDSILSQYFKNFELILVNDGSTDSSLSICNKYASLDKRIQVVNQTNGGVSRARNTGLSVAKGKWITFIDSDDWIGENFFSILEDGLDVDLIIGTIYIRTSQILCKFSENDGMRHDGSLFTSEQLSNTLFNGPCSKFYRRSLIEDSLLRFDEELYFGEDAVFVKTYLLHINSYYSTSDMIYYYDDIGENIYKKYNKSFAPILNYYRQVSGLYRRLEQKYKVILLWNDLVGMVYNIAIENISCYGIRDWRYLQAFLCDKHATTILRERNSFHISNILKLADLNNSYLFISYYRIIMGVKKVLKMLFKEER